jgi:hypothetical protein
MREVVERFRSAIDRGVTLERLGDENGYWRDTAGMHWVTAMG